MWQFIKYWSKLCYVLCVCIPFNILSIILRYWVSIVSYSTLNLFNVVTRWKYSNNKQIFLSSLLLIWSKKNPFFIKWYLFFSALSCKVHKFWTMDYVKNKYKCLLNAVEGPCHFYKKIIPLSSISALISQCLKSNFKKRGNYPVSGHYSSLRHPIRDKNIKRILLYFF